MYRASIAAVLVPGLMVAALAVLVAAGGFGRLGSLGQVFAGPQLPAGVRVASVKAGNTATQPLLAALLAGGTAGPTLAATASPSGSGAAGASPVSGGPSGGGRQFTGAPRPVGGGGGGTPPAGQPPPGPSPHPSTPVDRIVGIATSFTSRLPAPAGPLATRALQSTKQAVDRILPPAGRLSIIHSP